MEVQVLPLEWLQHASTQLGGVVDGIIKFINNVFIKRLDYQKKFQ